MHYLHVLYTSWMNLSNTVWRKRKIRVVVALGGEGTDWKGVMKSCCHESELLKPIELSI